METLLSGWLFMVGLTLLPVGAGMILLGLYTRTFRAVLVGAGLVLTGGIILLTGA